MATLSKTHRHSHSLEKVHSLQAFYKKWIEKLGLSHYAIVAMVIALSGGHGGVTVMEILRHYAPLWQLVVSVSFNVATLVACVAQNSTKWVINLFIISTLINAAILLIDSF